jgi:integrase
MARHKLTDADVKAATKDAGDGGGLWLRVRSRTDKAGKSYSTKSWFYRYSGHWHGLGAYPVVSLKAARNLALEAERAVHAGRDPIAERRAKKAEAAVAEADMTFEGVAELYIKAHEQTWRNPKHRWQWRQTLEAHAYPVFGKWPVQRVDTGAVMKVIEPLWLTLPETAARLRGRIETVLDYAKSRGWRTGDNPARWRGHVENLLPKRSKVAKVEHHAALPWKDMGAFMESLQAEGGTAAKALRFTILTAARTTEAIEARWQEIDLTSALWTVPGERMKAGREHRVPLSKDAVALLRTLVPNPVAPTAFIFAGARDGKAISNMAMAMLLRRMGKGELTVHGFRSTFRDWCGEATSYPTDLAEASLAHVLKSKTEQAYARGDQIEKRRKLMEAWAKFCATRPALADAAAVIGRAA